MTKKIVCRMKEGIAPFEVQECAFDLFLSLGWPTFMRHIFSVNKNATIIFSRKSAIVSFGAFELHANVFPNPLDKVLCVLAYSV